MHEAAIAHVELRREVLIAEFGSVVGPWTAILNGSIAAGALLLLALPTGTLPAAWFGAMAAGLGSAGLIAWLRLARYRRAFKRTAARLLRELERMKSEEGP